MLTQGRRLRSGSRRRLAENEVQVWWIALDCSDAVLARLRACLALDELARAGRLRAPRGSARFIAARGALRQILGAHLGCDPGTIVFSYGAYGKPALPGARGGRHGRSERPIDLRFNLSHSAAAAACALSLGREVGIDIEEIRPGAGDPEIASRYFSREDAGAIAAVTGEARDALFYRYWTRREACLKAEGAGVLSNRPTPPGRDGRWIVMDLEPPAGYAAALAVEGEGWRLTNGRWRLA